MARPPARRRGGLRRIARAGLALMLAATTAANAWVLSQHPFAAPTVARSQAELALAFDRAVARIVDADWLLPRLDAALAAGDLDAADALLLLAATHAVAVPPDARAAHAALVRRATGPAACAACAYEAASCRSLAQVAACNLPVELTAAGDLNALRRGLADRIAGRPVDRLDLALAAVGLAATGAVLATGGGSAVLKAGAGTVRVARRAGVLTAGLAARLEDAAAGAIRWDRAGAVLRGAPPSGLLDAARTATLAAAAADLGRIARATSRADALALLRHADSPADLARLARLAEAAGPATRPGLHALGLARAARLLVRLSDLALLALGLIAALAAQLALLAGGALGRLLRRRLAGGP